MEKCLPGMLASSIMLYNDGSSCEAGAGVGVEAGAEAGPGPRPRPQLQVQSRCSICDTL